MFGTTADTGHSDIDRLSDPELQDVLDKMREPQIRELLKYLVLLDSDAVRNALTYVQRSDSEEPGESARDAALAPSSPQHVGAEGPPPDLRGNSSSISKLSDEHSYQSGTANGSLASGGPKGSRVSNRSRNTRKSRKRHKKKGGRSHHAVGYDLLVLCTSKPASPEQANDQDKAMLVCKEAGLLPYIVLKEAKPQRALELVMISKTLEYPQFFFRRKSQHRRRSDRGGYSAATVSFLGSFDLIRQLHEQGMLNSNMLQREEDDSSSSSSSSDSDEYSDSSSSDEGAPHAAPLHANITPSSGPVDTHIRETQEMLQPEAMESGEEENLATTRMKAETPEAPEAHEDTSKPFTEPLHKGQIDRDDEGATPPGPSSGSMAKTRSSVVSKSRKAGEEPADDEQPVLPAHSFASPQEPLVRPGPDRTSNVPAASNVKDKRKGPPSWTKMLEEQENSAAIRKRTPRLPEGGACYLVYDEAAWELNIYYSESPVGGAVGVWTSPDIQVFKEIQGLGTSELIGNCASSVNERRNYLNGWCQFVKAAKSMDARVLVLDAGIPVDFYVYANGVTTRVENGEFDTEAANAVACLPRGASFATDLQGKRWSKAAKKIGDVAVFGSMKSKPSSLTKSESSGNPQNDGEASGSQLQAGTPSTVTEEVQPQEDTTTTQSSTATKASRYLEALSRQKSDNASTDTAKQPLAPTTFFCPNPSSEKIGLHQVSETLENGEGYSSALTAPNPEGGACYLLYEPESSGRLVEYFSKTPVAGAIGCWVPAGKKKIAGFKFKQNLGKNVLIGNCSAGVQGRKNYCSGWCQFVRSARVMQAEVMLWDPAGVKGMMVDVYLYQNDNRPGHQTVKLQRGVAVEVENVEAVACIPKNTAFYEGICVDILRWLADGGNYGASSRFE